MNSGANWWVMTNSVIGKVSADTRWDIDAGHLRSEAQNPKRNRPVEIPGGVNTPWHCHSHRIYPDIMERRDEQAERNRQIGLPAGHLEWPTNGECKPAGGIRSTTRSETPKENERYGCLKMSPLPCQIGQLPLCGRVSALPSGTKA